MKSLRIIGETLDSKLAFETHLREVVSKAAEVLVLCTEQVSYLIVPVSSRAVSMHMCPRVDGVCGVAFWFAD